MKKKKKQTSSKRELDRLEIVRKLIEPTNCWIEDGDLGSGWFPKSDCIKTKKGWIKKLTNPHN